MMILIYLILDIHSILQNLQLLLTRGNELQNILENSAADRNDYIPIQPINPRKLVASAISRLCLVLCAEWGKPSSGVFTDFGTFLNSADQEQSTPSSAVQFHRKLSGGQENSRKNDRNANTVDSEANLNKTLKSIMQIIKLLSPLPPG